MDTCRGDERHGYFIYNVLSSKAFHFQPINKLFDCYDFMVGSQMTPSPWWNFVMVTTHKTMPQLRRLLPPYLGESGAIPSSHSAVTWQIWRISTPRVKLVKHTDARWFEGVGVCWICWVVLFSWYWQLLKWWSWWGYGVLPKTTQDQPACNI